MIETVHITVLVSIFLVASVAEAWLPARPLVRDDRRLALNFGLGLGAMLIGWLPWIGPMAAAMKSAKGQIGALRHDSLPDLSWTLEAMLAVVLFSLASYGLHRLMHRFDLLWHVHKLHHQDGQLDFSTGFRSHPLEAILSSICLAIVTVLIGFDPIAVAAALILLQALDLAAHSNVDLPARAEALLGRVIVTPAIHSRHHSANRLEHDSNYGNGLIIWDRLFGTYSGRRSPDRLGLH